MRVMGLDPGLRAMGWGVIDVSGSKLRHVANGVCKTATGDLGGRLVSLFDQLSDIWEIYAPDTAAVEQTFVNKDGAGTLKLGQARGIAMLVPAQAGIPVGEYAPNKIKKLLKEYEPIKRMVYQGRGHKVRALFDQEADVRRGRNGVDHPYDAVAGGLRQGGIASAAGDGRCRGRCRAFRRREEILMRAFTTHTGSVAPLDRANVDTDAIMPKQFLKSIKPTARQRDVAKIILKEVTSRLEMLIAIGLDYLNLNRGSSTLSGGESQRIRLSSQIGSGLMGMLYVLDEPSIGLHPKDNVKMIETLKRLRDLGNTVIVVEHDEDTIRAADHVIEIGPGPGVHGGKVVVDGPLKTIMKSKKSITGQYLSSKKEIAVPAERRPSTGKSLIIKGARHNNLKSVNVEIPLEQFVCVTGASGSGKSSLIHEIVQKQLYSVLHDSRVLAGDHDELTGHEHVSDVINIDQSPIGRSSRSNPATYIGFYDAIRKLFAETDDAKKRGFTASTFSFNVKGGRCEECSGEGTITTQLSFMPDVEVTCPTCKGARYDQDTLDVKLNGKSIADVLDMSIEDGVEFFAEQTTIARKISVLNELGLGYLKLGHPSTILSGGEAQRVKLAAELGKLKRGKHNLYILDEPTTGLHFADIDRLLESLNRLVETGHSVVVIEHNLDVIKTADHVIDLGPEGGHKGGQVLATGTPEDIVKCRKSHTGKALAGLL